MKQLQKLLVVRAPRAGLVPITGEVAAVVREARITTGACHLFVRHTSASLLVQENADPSARHDLEAWFRRIAPEGDPAWTHTSEGPDDMPSHVRAALTRTSETIPVVGGGLGLGTWQGIYLFEHRRRPTDREILVHVWGE